MWIARDEDGFLFVYAEKPLRGEHSFIANCFDMMKLDSKRYPEVTWENSPVEVVLKLAKEE